MMYYDTVGESSNSYLRHVLLNELLAGQSREYLETLIDHEKEKDFQFDPEDFYILLTGIPKKTFFYRYGVDANRAMFIFVTMEREVRSLLEKLSCTGEFIIQLYEEKQFVIVFSVREKTRRQEIAETIAGYCCQRLQALYEQEFLHDSAFANVTLLSRNLHAWEDIGPAMHQMLKSWRKCAFFHMGAKVWLADEWQNTPVSAPQLNEGLHRIRQAVNQGNAEKARNDTRRLLLEEIRETANWYTLTEALAVIKRFELECVDAYDLEPDTGVDECYDYGKYPNIELLSAALEERMTALSDEIRSRDLHYTPLIRKAVRLLKDNYMLQDISLTYAADRLNVSASYLSGLFKKETGDSLTHYIVTLRVKKACELLKGTDLRVTEIAEQTGYNDKRYFTSVFRKETGCIPSVYREKCGNAMK